MQSIGARKVRENKKNLNSLVHYYLAKTLRAVWKNEKNYLITKEIFRQINSLVTCLVKPLLSRNFCQKCVRENSRNFYSVQCGKVL